MKRLIKFGKKLFPILRSLTGRGNLKTLIILKSYLPELKIKNFRSNVKVYDWKIPSEWNVTRAFILDKFKKKNYRFFYK